jgi:hypothetical protein
LPVLILHQFHYDFNNFAGRDVEGEGDFVDVVGCTVA